MTRVQLKIGFVLDDSLDSTDGVQQYVITLGKWLTSQGHSVKYLVGKSNRQDLDGIHSLGKNINVRFNQNALSIPLPTSRSKIRKIIDIEDFDVLHVQMPFSPFLAGRIISAAKPRTALVGTFHVLPASNFVSSATKVLGRVVGKRLARIDVVCCVSEPARKYMNQVFHIDGKVIPNGVDVSSFRPVYHKLETSIKPKIVFLGRLVERKGVEYLLRAFAQMKNRDQISLVIGGKGPLLNSLKRTVSSLGIDHLVSFIGFVPETEKAELLRSATIAVFPSVGGESFGIVLVEAIAAGANVVIGGDNPGYRTVLSGPIEQLVDPQDVVEFSKRLVSIIENPTLAHKLHNSQQNLLTKFDIETVGPKIFDLYQSALQGRK